MIHLHRRIKDSFKGHFLFLGYQPCFRRSSSLKKDILHLILLVKMKNINWKTMHKLIKLESNSNNETLHKK